MLKNTKYRKFWKDLSQYNHNPKELKVSFLRFLWNVYVKKTWDIVEVNTTFIENEVSIPVRAFFALIEKNKRESQIIIRHLRLFSRDLYFLKSTLPRFLNNLLVSYVRQDYDTILFCLNDENDPYAKYLKDNLENVHHFEKNNAWWNYKNKENYYILYFKIK